MRPQRLVGTLLVVLLLGACASAPTNPARSEFEDIPVPKGLTYLADKSTIIESPTVKAARLVYRGRLEAASLGAARRSKPTAGVTSAPRAWRIAASPRSTRRRGVRSRSASGRVGSGFSPTSS